MSNPYFEFKYFTVWHDRCAMKVGTDGVLLGAWASVENCKRILDIGTGSGLIALQLAQRFNEAQIVAIEVDISAAQQAEENVQRSSWADRISVVCKDFNSYVSDMPFDLIVSNPPYYMDALQSPDKQRAIARHTIGNLNYESLLRRSVTLLKDSGHLCLIVPAEQENYLIDVAYKYGLYPLKIVRVFTKVGKSCKRVLLTFIQKMVPCQEEALYIMQSDQQYTPQYKQLVKDFYLNLD